VTGGGRAVVPAALLAVALASAPARAQAPAPPLTAGPLTFRFEPAVAAETRALAAAAPALCAAVAADLGIAPPPAQVWVALRARDLGTGLPPGHVPPPWAGGVTYPAEGLIAIARAAPGGARQHLPTLLKHEYSHLALAVAAGHRPLPRWFIEGFAHVQAGETSLGRTETLAIAAAGGRLQPLDRLDRHFPRAEDLAALAYAESYDFVGYLREHGGAGGLSRLLAGVAAGRPFLDAFREAFGRSLGALEEEWRGDVRRRYVVWPLLTSGTLLWMGVSVLAVLAWRRRRRAQAARLQRMDEDERAQRVARAAAARAAAAAPPAPPPERLPS
jgi:hypothetical protein